jgi:hypothetical protein
LSSGRSRFCVESFDAYDEKIRVNVSFENLTTSSLPWASDVGADVEFSPCPDKTYRASGVGGSFAYDRTDFPAGAKWYGWFYFDVPPGQPIDSVYVNQRFCKDSAHMTYPGFGSVSFIGIN